MKLYDIAHARAGDKGDTADISVIAYRIEDYGVLERWLTPDRVKAHFVGIVAGGVTRYELPQLGALKFVMENALGGGVTTSLELDVHGKSLGSLILAMDVEIPDRTAHRE